ncbi:MAG: Gfo/Idh/MocA family oxidoreductase [Candidatus Omnitrophica bacterium]|nr:Gfo/Idh/MocA family oxidoreductase [Candidatus Omnitrophota bacterium]
MKESVIKVVLVGCGGISRAWVKPLQERKDARLVGLVDIRKEAAENLASQFNLQDIPVGTDLPSMLKTVQPEAVFDCTTPESHYSVAMTAFGHGCHVLAEKPMADTLSHAQKLVEISLKKKRIYAIIQNRRYTRWIRGIVNLVRSKILGQLTTLTSDFFIGAHFGGFRDRMKHVLLLDMAIHTFDAARFISGVDPVSVFCHEWNPVGSWYEHDASAIALFEMTGGVVYSYRGSWCAEGMNTSWEGQWRLIGSKGSAVWDGNERCQVERVKGKTGFKREVEKLEVGFPELPLEGHSGLIDEFLRCVRQGKKPLTAAEDNIKSLAMVLAAVESSQKNKPVKVVW